MEVTDDVVVTDRHCGHYRTECQSLLASFTDIAGITDVAGVMDIAGVTDITGVTDIARITGDTV